MQAEIVRRNLATRGDPELGSWLAPASVLIVDDVVPRAVYEPALWSALVAAREITAFRPSVGSVPGRAPCARGDRGAIGERRR